MSVLWMDGFDHYGLDEGNLESLYAQNTGVLSTDEQRTGSHSLRINSTSAWRRILGTEQTTVGLGFGVFLSALPTSNDHMGVLCQFRDESNRSHVSLHVSTTGLIRAMLGGYDAVSSPGTLLGQSSRAMAPGTWNHIEVKVVIHATTGSVHVKLNGREVIALTNINTVGPDVGESNIAQVAGGLFDTSVAKLMPAYYIDDLVAWDDQGANNNDFLGMLAVYYLEPVADVAPQDWALTSGASAWPLIDDLTPDDDTNYIFSTTVGDEAVFTVDALPADVDEVAAVQVIGFLRKTDSGACDVALGVMSGPTEEMAADTPITTSYGYYTSVHQIDPNTTDVWNPTAMPDIKVERTL